MNGSSVGSIEYKGTKMNITYNRVFDTFIKDKVDYFGKLIEDESALGKSIGGIVEKYYPTAQIWSVLDKSNAEKLEAIHAFYFETYYKKMRLHTLNDYCKSLVIFNVSVMFGKKKTTKIIQRILGEKQTGILDSNTIIKLHIVDTKTFVYEFLLESIQFVQYLTNIKYKEEDLRDWLGLISILFTIVQRELRVV